jgi:hypothetical protein
VAAGSVVGSSAEPAAASARVVRSGVLGPWRRSSRLVPHFATCQSASVTIAPLIFDLPRSRSVKVIGTSTMRNPACSVRHVMSIWKQ